MSLRRAASACRSMRWCGWGVIVRYDVQGDYRLPVPTACWHRPDRPACRRIDGPGTGEPDREAFVPAWTCSGLEYACIPEPSTASIRVPQARSWHERSLAGEARPCRPLSSLRSVSRETDRVRRSREYQLERCPRLPRSCRRPSSSGRPTCARPTCGRSNRAGAPRCAADSAEQRRHWPGRGR
jgi:hypothetical protein